MELEPADAEQNPAVAAFIAELRHWREVNGCSQKKLAAQVDYTPSLREQGRARHDRPARSSPRQLTSICGRARDRAPVERDARRSGRRGR